MPPSLSSLHALFVDFDGTLTDIQDNPDRVELPEGGAAVLRDLSERLGGALAILSGRDIVDLGLRVPQALWRIGGHGLDIAAPGEPATRHEGGPPEDLVNHLQALIAQFPGSRLEHKGRVIALHYRQIPDSAEPLLAEMQRLLTAFPDYRLQAGKMVMESKPAGANKGIALRKMMSLPPFADRRPVMIGDDVTDEDAMKAALEIGGIAIKVGEGETVAPYRLDDPQAVWSWLTESESA